MLRRTTINNYRMGKADVGAETYRQARGARMVAQEDLEAGSKHGTDGRGTRHSP